MILENNNAGSICKDNLKVRNTWSVSGDTLTIITDGDRLLSTTNEMKGGYDISASAGCAMTATIGAQDIFATALLIVYGKPQMTRLELLRILI